MKYILLAVALLFCNTVFTQTLPNALTYPKLNEVNIDCFNPFLNEGSITNVDTTIKYRISVVAKDAATHTTFYFYFGDKESDPVLSAGSQPNFYNIRTKLKLSELAYYMAILDSKDRSISYQELLHYPPTVRINKSIN